jgi:hypothetical protein
MLREAVRDAIFTDIFSGRRALARIPVYLDFPCFL